MNENHEKLLPGTITAIIRQKNNKSRYSVFINEQFLMGVSDETLLKLKLKQGIEITPAFFRKIQRDEGYAEVKNYMLKLISRRRHARKELWRKAQQKEYSPDIIEDVLWQLEEKDLIGDEQFAVKYAEDKSSLKKWGPNKIKAYLREKGVSRSDAETAVDKVYRSTNTEKRLLELVKKRKKHFLREADELKRKQKVIRYLLQKGYRSSSIYENIDGLMKLLKKTMTEDGRP